MEKPETEAEKAKFIRKDLKRKEKPIVAAERAELANLERVCLVLETAAYDILRGAVASIDPYVGEQLKQQGMAVFKAMGIVEGCLKFHRQWLDLRLEDKAKK